MYIQRLTVENYKGFEQAELEFSRADGGLAGWHVLAGPNGAGKSSVLAAIALALRAQNYAHRLLLDFTGQLRAGSKFGSIFVELIRDPDLDQFNDGSAFYASRADAESPGPYGPWTPPDDDPNDPLDVNAPQPSQFGLGMTMRARNDIVYASEYETENFYPSWAHRGPWLAEPDTGWMIAGYGPQRRLGGHSIRALELMKESSGVASLVTLFHDDASLAEASIWLRELARKREYAPISVELLLALLNDGLLPGDVSAKGLDEDGLLVVEQAGVELPIERLSDGYRAVTALVFDLVYRMSIAYGSSALEAHEGDGDGAKVIIDYPGVVLIDEAETHLHPGWQKKLGFWLVDHFPRIQFIVTTHSPFICQAAVHGSLTRLSPPGDPRTPGPLRVEDYWTVVNGSADEAVQTELFGLRRVISDDAEAVRDEVAELEVKELHEDLTDAERARLERSRGKLPPRPSAEIDGFKRLLAKVN